MAATTPTRVPEQVAAMARSYRRGGLLPDDGVHRVHVR